MIYIFQIDGNVGAGKSTAVSALQNIMSTIGNIKMPVIYLLEPVSIWESIQDSNGENILEKYYKNQSKYAFSFQMMAFITRIRQIKKLMEYCNNAIVICERSVFTDKEVFAKMLYDDKKIEEVEYSIYLKWFDELVVDIPISGIIYIKTDPEICETRIIKRNRKGENVPLKYLKNCHSYHENWLNNTNIPVLTLDGNRNFLNDFPASWLTTIQTFLIDLSPSLFKYKSPSYEDLSEIIYY
tara:strand:- start:296 stop:1015 length:720 start_codon:yes stop_codon:yes gene_type:complete